MNTPHTSTLPSPLQSEPSHGLLAPRGPCFLTEEQSPFADGYSIDKERAFLGADLEAGRAGRLTGPLLDRYIELEDREERLREMQESNTWRMGADDVVSNDEARSLRRIGRLVDLDVDQFVVHTFEASRLFTGRKAIPQEHISAIAGGKSVASALRDLWLMTGRDNPYADWALIRYEEEMATIHERMKRMIEQFLDKLRRFSERGMRFSVVANPEPYPFNLGFRSPFGYGIVQFTCDYDYFIRLMKTMERKDMLKDAQTLQYIRALNQSIRRVWNDLRRFHRWLVRDEMRDLSRGDFARGVTGEASKRVQFATEVFGAVPSAVYACALQPSHSRRKRRSTPEERHFLQHVSAQLAQAEEAEQPAAAPATGELPPGAAGTSAGA
jgi:integrating conjugative element protein (TIGR03761 family)